MSAATQRRKRAPRKRRGPGRPRAADTSQRERLLDAATQCFTSEGIAATSLRSIAIEAGVTPALVHYYFGSKERLLAAFVAERLMPVVASIAAGVRDTADPRELVAAFVHGLHAAVARNPWLPALWLHEVLGERGRLRDVLTEQIANRVPRRLAERFAALKRAGALNPDLDPRLLVVSLVGLTLFPLAAEPVWRRLFDAADIDYAALERHTLALLNGGFGGTREP